MYNNKEKEQFNYDNCYDEISRSDNNSNCAASCRNERNFDTRNNNCKPMYSRDDNRYDSAGNMRNSSYQSRNNTDNNARNSSTSQYSSMNRYFGTPQVRNDIESNASQSNNRVVAQNQNTTGSAIRNTRVTESSDYDIYNNKPKAEKNKVSLRAKICILVICAIVVLAIGLTVANLIPSASAQGGEQVKQEVTIDEQVGKVVDEQGVVKDLALVQSGNDYKYDTKTNWFDGFCDWIENLVG